MLRPFLGFVGVCQFAMLTLSLTAAGAFAQTPSSDLRADGSSVPGNGRTAGGNPGGVTRADFDPLVDLIQSTIGSEDWEGSGGSATLMPYVGGVFADANGTLRFRPASTRNKKGDEGGAESTRVAKLAQRDPAFERASPQVRCESDLRCISLRLLETFIGDCLKKRRPLPAEVLTLAGLQEIRYVVVVPASGEAQGDLILAGPAGDWQTDPGGMVLSVKNNRPVVRLDDLLTLWRRASPSEPFGVTIQPRAAGLAGLQQYLSTTTVRPIKARHRERWVEGIRERVGDQDVRFFGLAPDSHVASVLLTADYHMKCIGMGVADSVDGVRSYLKTVKLDANGQVPPMTVLRWWFAMNYQPVTVCENEQVFELNGPGARVLSENQLLTARGQRIGTGKSEPLNRQFATTFTKQFVEICEKYPLYSELKNVFDLSMTLALIDKQHLLERANWRPSLLLDGQKLKLPEVLVAAEVAPIINHRVIGDKQIVVGVSGGVWVDARKHLKIHRTDPNGGPSFKMPAALEMRSGDDVAWWWD